MSNSVFPNKAGVLKNIFEKEKPIIGMVHLLPLPGSPHYKGQSMNEIIEHALEEASTLEQGGVDGIQIENAWDLPFSKPEDIGYETVATMSVIGSELRNNSSLPLGVNVLANAVIPSISIAKACNADWVRSNQWVNAYIANEGFIEGASAKAMRYKSNIYGYNIKVMADVHVKHGSHSIVADRSIYEQTKDNEFFAADVLIATGNRTGDETEIEELKAIKDSADLPVIIGSGMTADNADKIMSVADGAIVGSYFKENGNWWEKTSLEKVQRFMDEVQVVRNSFRL